MRQDPETGSKRRPDRIDIIATAVLLIFTAALHLLYILITYMAFDRTNIAVGIDYEIPFIKEFAIPYVMWYAFHSIPSRPPLNNLPGPRRKAPRYRHEDIRGRAVTGPLP